MSKMMLSLMLLFLLGDLNTPLKISSQKLYIPSSELFLGPPHRKFLFLEEKAHLRRRTKILSKEELLLVHENAYELATSEKKDIWCNKKENFIDYLANKKYQDLDFGKRWSTVTDITTQEKEQIKFELAIWCSNSKKILKPIKKSNGSVERLTKPPINSNQSSTASRQNLNERANILYPLNTNFNQRSTFNSRQNLPERKNERLDKLGPVKINSNQSSTAGPVNINSNQSSTAGPVKINSNQSSTAGPQKLPERKYSLNPLQRKDKKENVSIEPVSNWKLGVELGLEIEMNFFTNSEYYNKKTDTDRECKATKKELGITTVLRNCIENQFLSLGFKTNKYRMIGFDYKQFRQTGNKDYEFRTIGGLSFSEFSNSITEFTEWLAPIYQQHLISTNEEKNPSSIYSFNYEVTISTEKKKFLLTFTYDKIIEKPNIILFPQITFSCDINKFEELITFLMKSNVLTNFNYPQLLIFDVNKSQIKTKIYSKIWENSAWDSLMKYKESLSQLSTSQKIIIYWITSMFHSSGDKYESEKYDKKFGYNFLKARFKLLPKVPEQFLGLDCKDLDHDVFVYLKEQELVLPYRIKIPTKSDFEYKEFFVRDYLDGLKEMCNKGFKWKSNKSCLYSFLDCYLSEKGVIAVRSTNQPIERLLPASFFRGDNKKILFEIRGINKIILPNKELKPFQSAIDIIKKEFSDVLDPLIDSFKSK